MFKLKDGMIIVEKPLGEVDAATEHFLAGEQGYLAGEPRRAEITRESIKYILCPSLVSALPWEIKLRAIGNKTEITFWQIGARLYDFDAEEGIFSVEWERLDESQIRLIERYATELLPQTPSAETEQAAKIDIDQMDLLVNELLNKSMNGESPEELMEWIGKESGVKHISELPTELQAQQAEYNKEMILLTMQESARRIKKHFTERGKKAQNENENAKSKREMTMKPGKNATREDWFRYYYECKRNGTIRFTHKDLGRAIDLAEGTARNYYSDWLAENNLEDDTN